MQANAPLRPPNGKTIAVIAIHGVGDQPQLDTVRRIGDLLQDLDQSQTPGPVADPCATPPGPERPAYYPFREQPIRINVRPTVVTEEREREAAKRHRHGPFHAWVMSPQARSTGADDTDRIPNEF